MENRDLGWIGLGLGSPKTLFSAKKGGFLIYVVCSLLEDEGELVVNKFLMNNQSELSLDDLRSLLENNDEDDLKSWLENASLSREQILTLCRFL